MIEAINILLERQGFSTVVIDTALLDCPILRRVPNAGWWAHSEILLHLQLDKPGRHSDEFPSHTPLNKLTEEMLSDLLCYIIKNSDNLK